MDATDTKRPARSSTEVGQRAGSFTAEERAAMKERARELKAGRGGRRAGQAGEEGEVLAKIAEMPEPDRGLAERLHALIKATAPDLAPRTWYGMPAYTRNGKVVCFFKPAAKFKVRYATLGFSDQATLDDGAMWPTEYAVTELTTADETRIAALVRKAVN